MNDTSITYLVTGAAGFVGRRLAEQLIQKGKQVRTLDRVSLDLPGADHIEADLRDVETVTKAIKGVEVIFHVASLVSIDPREDAAMYETNIVATQKLLEIARKERVTKFIYTSSIDVVFEGKPIRRGDESLPYAHQFLDYYSYTKATAEQAVLAANNPMGMLTCALRPAGIYGPGDTIRLPAILEQVQKKKWFQIGNGKAEFNHVYVDNVVHAHLLAEEALTPDSVLGGQAYFVTDHPPQFFFDFFTPIIEGLGYRLRRKKISYGLATMVAHMMHWWHQLPWNKHKPAPTLTRYVVASTARDFSFVHEHAHYDFGYNPVVSQEEALKETLRDLRKRGYAAHAQGAK